MRVRVDRIENSIAVCELEDGTFKDIKLAELPEETKEGSIIEINEADAVLLKKVESEKRKKNFEKMSKLFSKNSLQ